MNENQITGSLGKGGHSLFKFSEELIFFLRKIEQLKDKQSDSEMFKNINGKWSRPCATVSGAGKPNAVKGLIFKERNQLVIGELGRGMGYHPLLIKN